MSDKNPRLQDIFKADFGYDYGVMNFHPSSDLSKRICSKIKDRKAASCAVRNQKSDVWKKVDNKKRLFVPTSSVEKKQKAKDPTLPLATLVPYTLGALDMLTSKYAKDYLRRTIHRFEGFGSPEAIAAGVLRERVVSEADCFFKNHLHIESVFEAAMSYSYGMCGTQWRKHKRYATNLSEVTPLVGSLLSEAGFTGQQVGDYIESTEELIEYEGTEVVPVNNWNSFVDPRVTGNNFQKSEYWGYMWDTSATDLLKLEEDSESGFTNAKYVQLLAEAHAAKDPLYNYGGLSDKQAAKEYSDREEFRRTVHVTTWVQKLIPDEWGLGDSSSPECWCFATTGDCIVLSARKMEEEHGLNGGSMMAPTTDGHDSMPIAMLERTYGISEAIDWLMRSRMHELMTAGTRSLYHPLYVPQEDMNNPVPQQSIALRPEAWNRPEPISNWIHQFEFRNATAGHWGDISSLLQVAKDTDSTVEVIRGDMSSLPDRPGQLGVSAALSGGLSRVDHMLWRCSRQFLYDLCYMIGCNIDQYMSQEVFINAVGRDAEQDLREIFGADAQQVGVTREDLLYNRRGAKPERNRWRVTPHDEPASHPENVQSMMQFGQMIFQNPIMQQELARTVDPTRFFFRLAELGGMGYAKELLRRRPQPMVAGMMQDEEIDKQVQAGNVVTQEQAVEAIGQ